MGLRGAAVVTEAAVATPEVNPMSKQVQKTANGKEKAAAAVSQPQPKSIDTKKKSAEAEAAQTTGRQSRSGTKQATDRPKRHPHGASGAGHHRGDPGGSSADGTELGGFQETPAARMGRAKTSIQTSRYLISNGIQTRGDLYRPWDATVSMLFTVDPPGANFVGRTISEWANAPVVKRYRSSEPARAPIV